MTDDIRCEVDGVHVSASMLRVRSMNFGQHWRTPGAAVVRYRVLLPTEAIVGVLTPQWKEYIDCEREDFQSGNLDFPLTALLQARDWPNPVQAMDDPEVAPLLVDWFAHEILLRTFGDAAETAAFVINTAKVGRSGERWSIEGEAARCESLQAYQDW